jgi:hypothetical protein
VAQDERLRRELERAARPADPSGVYEDLIRRRERRRLRQRVRRGALAVAVVVGSGVGLYGLSLVFGDSERGRAPSPAATAPAGSPTASAPPPAGEDIGLGFPVCDVTSVAGDFAPGVVGRAFVATRTGDTGDCPTDEGASQLVAVDVTGDGEADASYGPLECDPFCSAFAAPDVDGDGSDELLVQNVQFSIAGLRLYDVGHEPAEVGPVTLSTPGYPGGGLLPGIEPQLWTGGDAFQTTGLRCEDRAGGRVLVLTSASEEPPDSVDSMWIASEITFRLDADGTAAVIDHRTFEEPATSDAPSFATGPTICGAPVPRAYRGG